jgi:ABC-type branched-subunit amino acid transport system ATPase component/branched-subunit amino acid ABC-type transport system permease component
VNSLLPFIVSGLVVGAVYSLAGTGLVLTYKTSGIFNFGHGAVAAAAAYVFYWLYVTLNLAWPVALFISVAVLGPLLGLGFEYVGRYLSEQPPAMKVAGTVGTVLIVEGIATVAYGPNLLQLPQFLPDGQETVQIAHVYISYAQIITVGVSLLIVGGLYALFRFTRTGVAMRAVVDDPHLLALHGTSPKRVRRTAWVIGSTLAALSGVLLAPIVGLQAITLTFIVVQAFGAAAIGGFTNIPLTYVGGLVIGVVASISTRYAVDHAWLAGVPDSLPFIVLLIVLLVLPRRRLEPKSQVQRQPTQPWVGPGRARAVAAIVIVALLALVPEIVGVMLPQFTLALVQGILLLSLGLLVRTAGIVSLSQAAFAAIGAVAYSQFMSNLQLPWAVSLLLGALVVVPVAALLAVLTLRLAGLFLALATLGFGITIQELGYTTSIMFSQNLSGRPMPRPFFAGADRPYYYVVLAVFVVVALVIAVIHRGRLGRIVRGTADSPVAVSTLGLNVTLTRVIMFCISGYIAGIAGVLYGSAVHYSSYGDPFFGPFASLVLLAVLVIQPFRQPWYAVSGLVLALVPAYLHGTDTTYWLNVLFGIAAVVVAMQGGTKVMPDSVRRAVDRIAGRRPSPPPPSVPAGPPASIAPGAGLEVSGLSVAFGGLVAVRDLSLKAPRGRITGLIGPNGAGKTTTFNSCSGLVRPTEGWISLDGRDITALSPPRRGQLGLGRTFQIMQLGESLTVAENVSLGREAAAAGSRVLAQLYDPPGERAASAAAVSAALELCGITEIAHERAGTLSTGQRRLVELARCLAGSFSVLLLDEPSSGLDDGETRELSRILERVVAERNVGILLVEHDMSLVMGVCSHIYVLDFGTLLFEGSPKEVAASPVVRAAYLGEADTESGPEGDEMVGVPVADS